MQKNLLKGRIRKKVGGGINIVKGDIQGLMDITSKESVGNVIECDYLVLHMYRLTMVSSWTKFTSPSVLYDENDSELVLSLLVYLPLHMRNTHLTSPLLRHRKQCPTVADSQVCSIKHSHSVKSCQVSQDTARKQRGEKR